MTEPALSLASTCGLDAALMMVGGKWKPLILLHLGRGVYRYGELRRAIGQVSDKMLIQQLKELQADSIIQRIDYGETPPKVEYLLTPLGHSLADALAPLCVWGTKHSAEIGQVVARRLNRARPIPNWRQSPASR